MATAVQVVVANVKRLLNRGNPTGKNPSKPGEPPKKVSAQLQGSITGIVERDGDQVLGAVGTNLKKARRLEFGFVGRDSAGRVIDQGERPFLRPGLRNSIDKVKKILGGTK